jgi:peptidoglycan hydrolase-like protein with peptidoglycan-binding domain
MRKLLAAAVFVVLVVPGTATAARVDPQVAGLQVALRAYGLYGGAIDGIAGPKTTRGVERFQQRTGLPVDGRAGPATRRALGPLGRPLFGRRTLRRGSFGWDVSVLQFLLARRGALVPIDGYFDARTERAVKRFQRARSLTVDGIAGARTLTAFRARPRAAVHPVLVSATIRAPQTSVRDLLNYWAGQYGVDPKLVRAVAWMESGYQTNLTSAVGAWGVMQILPQTWNYVETVLTGESIPRTASGNIRVGVLYLRELLREFNGNERRALAGWYQGPASVRKHGLLHATKVFVADVLALRASSL